MPFNDPKLYSQHILESIAHVEGFTAGMDYASHQADRKTKSATERCLQIISEAAIRLGNRAQMLTPTTDWRSVRGIGNRLRHGYDFVIDEVICKTIQLNLPGMRETVTAALLRTTSRGTDKP